MKDGLDAQTYMDQFHNYDHHDEHDGSPYLEWWDIPTNPIKPRASTTAQSLAKPTNGTALNQLI